MEKNGNTSEFFEKPVLKSNKDWRFVFPEWDTEKCNRCGNCWLACPDSAIIHKNDGCFEANESLCKGCGVCAEQCVTGSISLVPVAVSPPWLIKLV